MRRNFHLSLVLALAFLFSLSTVAIAQDDSCFVYGVVTDARTLDSLEGAEVTAWNYWVPDSIWYDTTGVDGYYWIRLTSSLTDTFRVEAKATGFTPDTADYAPQWHGDSLEQDFALTGPYINNFDSSLVEDSLCQLDSSLTERRVWNTGADTLVYTVERDSAWIVVTPVSGKLGQWGDDTLYIWLHALTGMVGEYLDTIVIVNNSPDSAIRIPVQLTALPLEAYIDVDTSSIDTTLAPDSTATYVRTMTNTGWCVNLTFAVTTDSAWLTVDPTSGSIPPNGGTQDLTITCTGPDSAGVYVDYVTINSDDPNSPHVIKVTVGVLVGVEDEEGGKLPTSFALRRCYPNPFNTSTTIGYDLPRASLVTLEVYNLVGQKVATLVNGYEQAGYKTVNWNAAEVTTGIYYYKLTAGEFVSVRKLTILK